MRLPTRLWFGPKSTGRQLVDDHDVRMIRCVAGVEGASLLEASSESVEVITVHGFEKHLGKFVHRRLRLSFYHKRTTATETVYRMRTSDGDVLHARQRAQAAFQLVEESDALLVIGVLVPTKSHLRGQ